MKDSDKDEEHRMNPETNRTEDRQINDSETDDSTDLYDWIFPNYSRSTKIYMLDTLCGVLVMLTLIGFLDTDYWLLSLPTHLRVQYTAGFAGVSIGYLWLNLYYRVPIPLVFMCLLSITIAPLYMPPDNSSAQRAVKSEKRITLMSMNLLTENEQTRKVRNLIRRKQPDVILLMEMNQRWLDQLEPLFDTYPYRTAQPRPDNFGIALFSRKPFEEISIRRVSSHRVPVVFASVRHEGRTIRLVGLHALPAWKPDYFHGRNELLSVVSAELARVEGPKMVIGDLNTTSWSSHFQSFTKTAGVRDSRYGFGIQPTWPAIWYHPLKMSLDHCLVSREFIVRHREADPYIGSDHYPILVELALRDRGTTSQD